MLKVANLKGKSTRHSGGIRSANMFGPTASWGRCDIFACEGGAVEGRGRGQVSRLPWWNTRRTKSQTPFQ